VDGEAEGCEYCGSAIVRDLGQRSLICPECYARCHESARFCTACGVGFRPEEVRLEGHERPRPVCEILMSPQQVGGLSINECTKCRGLWVPGQNFDLLVARAIEARRDAGPEQLLQLRPRVRGANPAAQGIHYRRCPDCQAYMQRRNFHKSSGVITDVCRQHGTWLDADELEQIAGFLLSGGQPSPTLTQPPVAERRIRADAAGLDLARWGMRSGSGGEGGVVGSLLEILTGLLK
jgi:Zn-finger nucleic acid-binding protein